MATTYRVVRAKSEKELAEKVSALPPAWSLVGGVTVALIPYQSGKEIRAHELWAQALEWPKRMIPPPEWDEEAK